MTTCKAPLIFNSKTGKCEMFKVIPPEYCASNDLKVNLYTLIYNKQTMRCEGEDKTDPKKPVKIIDFPTCIPGTTVMPEENNWCRLLQTEVDPKKEFESDAPPGPSSDEFLSRLMAKDAIAEEKAAKKAIEDEAAATKKTNNILLFSFLIFIITGIGLYFFFK